MNRISHLVFVALCLIPSGSAGRLSAQNVTPVAGGLTSNFVTWLNANGYSSYGFQRADLMGGSYGGKVSDSDTAVNVPVISIHGNADKALGTGGLYQSGWTSSIESFLAKGYKSSELYATPWGLTSCYMIGGSTPTCGATNGLYPGYMYGPVGLASVLSSINGRSRYEAVFRGAAGPVEPRSAASVVIRQALRAFSKAGMALEVAEEAGKRGPSGIPALLAKRFRNLRDRAMPPGGAADWAGR